MQWHLYIYPSYLFTAKSLPTRQFHTCIILYKCVIRKYYICDDYYQNQFISHPLRCTYQSYQPSKPLTSIRQPYSCYSIGLTSVSLHGMNIWNNTTTMQACKLTYYPLYCIHGLHIHSNSIIRWKKTPLCSLIFICFFWTWI